MDREAVRKELTRTFRRGGATAENFALCENLLGALGVQNGAQGVEKVNRLLAGPRSPELAALKHVLKFWTAASGIDLATWRLQASSSLRSAQLYEQKGIRELLDIIEEQHAVGAYSNDAEQQAMFEIALDGVEHWQIDHPDASAPTSIAVLEEVRIWAKIGFTNVGETEVRVAWFLSVAGDDDGSEDSRSFRVDRTFIVEHPGFSCPVSSDRNADDVLIVGVDLMFPNKYQFRSAVHAVEDEWISKAAHYAHEYLFLLGSSLNTITVAWFQEPILLNPTDL